MNFLMCFDSNREINLPKMGQDNSHWNVNVLFKHKLTNYENAIRQYKGDNIFWTLLCKDPPANSFQCPITASL